MTTEARRAAFRLGHRAERLCVWSLRLRAYRILARRFRVPAGEIDLIARRGRIVTAIEVKARGDYGAAAEAVTPKQRRRIARALEHFLGTRPDLRGHDLRFDVMLVTPGRLPRHIRDAWRPEES